MQGESRELVAQEAAAEVVENRVVLNLEGIRFDRKPGVAYEVYINLPKGQEPIRLRRFWSCCLSLAFMYPRKCSVPPGRGSISASRLCGSGLIVTTSVGIVLEHRQQQQQMRQVRARKQDR
jgi:hypothetical protein